MQSALLSGHVAEDCKPPLNFPSRINKMSDLELKMLKQMVVQGQEGAAQRVTN